MASIRARLTAWNGGVLVLVLLVFAIAGYLFLRYATLAQVDRALRQQLRVVMATAGAPQDSNLDAAAEDQAHIFERFYRGDRARGHQESETGAGAGLGLAIAREIAELHGGSVELRQSDESGSVFDLILPVHLAG